MTARELILARVTGSFAAVVGVFFLVYFCVYKPIVDGNERLTTATKEYDEAEARLAEENRLEKRITEVDPRLSQWQRLSVPECPDKDVLAHNTRMQVEYDLLISKLFKDSGLNITKKPKPTDPENKTAPALNKNALYTRFIFNNIEAEGSYDSLVKMLDQFQRVPLLHKIAKMELLKVAPSGGVPVRGAVPAAGPGRNPLLKIVLTLELLQVSGAEKRYTLLPYSLGGGLAFGPAQAVLLLPPGPGYMPRTVAEPDRNYLEMLAKNIFFGQPRLSESISSDHFEALRFNKLVCIRRIGYSRPEGLVYDQRKPVPTEATSVDPLEKRNDNRYIFLWVSKAVDFTIRDDNNNEILLLRVVDMTADEVLFKVVKASDQVKKISEKRAFPDNRSLTSDRPLLSDDPEQIYRMRVGDFLTDALASRFLAPKTDSEKPDKSDKTEKTEKVKTEKPEKTEKVENKDMSKE